MALEIIDMVHAKAAVTGPNATLIKSCSICRCENNMWRPIEQCQPFFAPPPHGGGQYIDPASRTAVAAARLIKDSIPTVASEKIGCILATNSGNAYSIALFENMRLSGKRPRPLLFSHAGWNVPVALIAAEIGFCGFTSTLLDEDRSASEILQYADSILEFGRAEQMVIGFIDLKPLILTETPDPVLEASCVLCVVRLASCGCASSSISHNEFMRACKCQ